MRGPRWSPVVFDLDGTLVDTIGLIVESYKHAFRTVLGQEVDEAWARSWIGQPLIRAMEQASPEHAQALYDSYLEHNRAHTEELIAEYDGVRELLEALAAARVPVAVATSKRRAQAHLALSLLGLTDLVGVVVAMEDTEAHKPDPEPLLLAIERAGGNRADAARAAYVGDAHVDVLAARAAGMAPIAVTWGAGTARDLYDAGAEVLISTPEDLRALLLGEPHSIHRNPDPDNLRVVLEYARERLLLDPVPLDRPLTPEQLREAAGVSITPEGIGATSAMRRFAEVLAPACLSVDHPRFLSFIPCAPTKEAALFDVVVGASSIYAGSWLEGSGAVYAENEALRWIADLAQFPAEAGGVFVPGGTVGNLSALVTARYTARARARAEGRADVRPFRVAATAGSHSSIASACEVMDAELVTVPGDDRLRMTGSALRSVLAEYDPATFFAVVATAGTTNLGIVDDLDSVSQVCTEAGLWLHVDGAYGLAGLAAESVRGRFAGVDRADSFIVDPHKWLFAPFDCCALIYRDPTLARAANTQRAGYLDVLNDSPDWNPTDYAVGLTRRARGLPLWFSLATHGTEAYSAAIERTVEVARYAAAEIDRRADLELVREPDLTVVVFRRVGWSPQDYHEWSQGLLTEQVGFVVPTTHEGETLARFAIVNPRTTELDIDVLLDSMG